MQLECQTKQKGPGFFLITRRSPPGAFLSKQHSIPKAGASFGYQGLEGTWPVSEVTRILSALEQGDSQGAEDLLPLVYDELRRLAALRLAHERPGQTLQPTALVHEAYLRLVGGHPESSWHGRSHFFKAAAEAMRRILVDRAREERR